MATPPSLDLSKVRHDLRSPINQIIGYCELLMEEEPLPPDFLADLRRIRLGGQQLLVVISEYFDESKFEDRRRNLPQLYHDLRTPVNHIIGYCEMLQEQCVEADRRQNLQDLQRIHSAAHAWLGLMETHLLPVATVAPPEPARTPAAVVFRPPPPPRPIGAVPDGHGKVLVVDDDADNRELLSRRLARHGYEVQCASSGPEALERLHEVAFDLVLLDLILPGLDGYQVLGKMKADPELQHLPVLMISGLDQENGIARCIEAGAEDYLTKHFNPVMLRARLGACLEKKRLRDQEQATYRALVASQQQLAAELAEAGSYVSSLLPPPLTSAALRTEWCFQPCTQLGGDGFGYHWVDEDNFAVYLLDVCGHGVGAALLAVSALNVLRSGSLWTENLADPARILTALNRMFPMEAQNQQYFTLWLGLYHRPTHQLTFASAGHPPALLLAPGAKPQTLRTSGPPIGAAPAPRFSAQSILISPGSELYVLSDGVYELPFPDGNTGTLPEFLAALTDSYQSPGFHPRLCLEWARTRQGKSVMEDDYSLIRLRFAD